MKQPASGREAEGPVEVRGYPSLSRPVDHLAGGCPAAAFRPTLVIRHSLPPSASMKPSFLIGLRARLTMTCHRGRPFDIVSKSSGFSAFVSKGSRRPRRSDVEARPSPDAKT